MATKAAVKKKVAVEVESKATVLTDVKAYAHKVWLAGLGAYVKAGQEGAGYFKELVKAGEGVEKQGKKLVTEQVDAANSQISSQLESVKSSVFGVKEKVEVQLDKVEKAFDSRVASALNRLGIPSKQDVEALSAKLDELNALLERVARTQ
ncbi:poly(3-hydroxyalkanoate) granule-associated protein PhaI [Pseudomonas sp. L-22-4S-12]|jgi:poly(hydroxyalkanoate) granule-associated protein|uniref:phasin family protein n=1 Tax=unclassified Pseudomonas TaxID=196821 RepID=UPI001329A8A1|nr:MULTISPECIES: phasin family protein [unclassified Pseudomonas]MWV12367.1 poly(3-hydroxyalkanoate) granule-associated protein PhaI [Pseudomonas sp. R-28-1W-6]MWV15288.1 poly(3-hydroxyalkanoate) granule-associated protein PhaI [Pseudomonas sp. L-22-4S-12]